MIACSSPARSCVNASACTSASAASSSLVRRNPASACAAPAHMPGRQLTVRRAGIEPLDGRALKTASRPRRSGSSSPLVPPPKQRVYASDAQSVSLICKANRPETSKTRVLTLDKVGLSDIYTQTLARAAEAHRSTQALASLLHVPESTLLRRMSGRAQMPVQAFLELIRLLT